MKWTLRGGSKWEGMESKSTCSWGRSSNWGRHARNWQPLGILPTNPMGQVRWMSGTAKGMGCHVVGRAAIRASGIVGPAYGVTVGPAPCPDRCWERADLEDRGSGCSAGSAAWGRAKEMWDSLRTTGWDEDDVDPLEAQEEAANSRNEVQEERDDACPQKNYFYEFQVPIDEDYWLHGRLVSHCLLNSEVSNYHLC